MQASVVCSACKNEVVVTDHECGEVICSRCGIVIDRIESPAVQEWRAFSVDEFFRKSRTGAPTSLARFNKGLLTSIGNGNARKNGLNFNRMRVWDFRIQAANDRSLKQALPELEHLKESLALPETIVEKSAYFYRKSSRLGLIKGRTVSSVLAASVYLACRELDNPRTLNEIAAAGNIARKKISRDYRLLVRIFDPKNGVNGKLEHITMNQPLEYGGYTFYQSSLDPTGLYDATGKQVNYSGFTVNRDPGIVLKYAGSLMLGLGIAIMFYMKAYFFKPRRRPAVET